MTMRGVDWAVVLGGSAIGTAILAGCVAFADDGPPLPQVRLALVALAAAAAFVLDEPGADTVERELLDRVKNDTASEKARHELETAFDARRLTTAVSKAG